MIKLIKKLQVIINTLKARAIKKHEKRIELAAERIDAEYDISEKRLAMAEAIKKSLEERAYDKLDAGIDAANKAKADAAKAIEELNSI